MSGREASGDQRGSIDAKSPDDDFRYSFSTVVALSISNAEGPVAAVARNLVGELGGRLLAVLDLRLDHTLAEVGARLCVTRERVRQLENQGRARSVAVLRAWAAPFEDSWREKLQLFAASETELFQGLTAPDSDREPQLRLLRIALVTLLPEATHPFGLTGDGWWTSDQTRVRRMVRTLAASGPMTDCELNSVMSALGVPASFPIKRVLNEAGSPLRFHLGASAWVRSRARHRDAAVAILRACGEPKSQEDLAEPLGITSKALHANLVRDHRLRQVQPSGFWILEDWADAHDSELAFQTTIEAVVSTLRDHGPLTRKQLVHRVTEIFPVSDWAVVNALESESVGQTDTGSWDLTERGARPRPLRRPVRPTSVTESADGRILSFRRPVDGEVLRGSGLGISAYIGWRLGLARPGERRVFSASEFPAVSIRRSYGSCSVSSLRVHVAQLGGQIGQTIEVTLDLQSDHYALRLLNVASDGLAANPTSQMEN